MAGQGGTETERRSERAAAGARAAALQQRHIPGLEACVLFGSVARGEAEPWSDVDIAVIGTREACAKAGQRLPEELEGMPVQVVAITAESGYQGLDVYGRIGREVVETGIPLWGGRRVRSMAQTEARPMGRDEVWREHQKTLVAVCAAVEWWTKATLQVDMDEVLEKAARETADAAEFVLKEACRLRGRRKAGGHDSARIVREAARQKGTKVLDEPDTNTRLEQMREALNGWMKADHGAVYTTIENNAETRARIEKRLTATLRYAREETVRLSTTQDIGPETERARKARAAVSEAARKLAATGVGQALSDQCKAWTGQEPRQQVSKDTKQTPSTAATGTRSGRQAKTQRRQRGGPEL